MARKLFKSKKLAPAILLLASTLMLSMVVGAGLNSVWQFGNTPEEIVPTNTAGVSLDVLDAGGSPIRLNIAQDASGKASYVDPNSVYSPVQAYASDTWLSDINAVPIADGYAPSVQESWPLPIYSGSQVLTVQMVYHYVVWMTVEVVLRTGPANTFSYVPSTTRVSPLDGTAVSGFGPDSHGLYTVTPYGSETSGALTIWESRLDFQARPVYKTNTMSSPNVGTGAQPTHAPYAQVTTSMLPYTNWRDMVVPTITSSLPSATATALAGIASAKPVIARATVNVAANTETIQAYDDDFAYTLANGTVVNVAVNTVSAAVGFSGQPNGLRSTGTYTGLVPNVNPAHDIPTFDLSDPTVSRGGSANYDRVDSPTTTVTATGVSGSVGITGSLVPTYELVETVQDEQYDIGIPSGSIPYTTGGGYGAPAVLDLSDIAGNCGLPETLTATVSNTMAPRVTAYNTVAVLTTQRAYINNDNAFAWTWDVATTTQYLEWCYGLQVDNTCTVQKLTFPVDVVSERAVQLFASDGSPIDIASITDTDVNAIFNDPRLDTLIVHDNTPGIPNLWDWLLSIPYIGWIVAALVIVVIVAIMWIVGKIGAFFKPIIKFLRGK